MQDAGSPAMIHARIGADGRILSADAPLLQLQILAGGEPDGRLIVPQLAALVRLVRQMGVLMVQPVQAAGVDSTIGMWVRARPAGDGVELLISDWRETPLPLVDGQDGARAGDIALSGEGWRWRTDADLRFVDAGDEGGGPAPGHDERPASGSAFAAFFPIGTESEAGGALVAALERRRPFFGEEVSGAGTSARRYLLSGAPILTAHGEFSGFQGRALALPARAEMVAPEPVPGVSPSPLPDNLSGEGPFQIPDFGKRLDRALRQPLVRIIANAETISSQIEGPLRDDYTSYAADIADAGRHLMELVDDLADLQAVDRPNFQVACEELDLADIARRTAGLLALKAADRHIQLQIPPVGERMPAMGEFRRALQIAVNLVGNAVRYSPEHSQVWLRVDEEADMALLVIADQGRGIAPEDQDRMFEKFERLGRNDAAGSGLGLYISRRLARAMGGDIRVDSAPGQGARFILSLPKAKA